MFRILIIEDDKEWANTFRSILKKLPFIEEIKIALTYIKALRLLNQYKFNLIVLDLCLTCDDDYNGMKLLDYLLSEDKKIPTIIVSGYGKVQHVRDGFIKYNIHDYFSKQDFEINQFRKAVTNAINQQIRNQIFISYSHKDAKWLDKLQIMLKPLEREKKIILWSDAKIETGKKWKSEIKKALDLAKIAILLVSPYFLASDFIVEYELTHLLEIAEKQGLKIIWIPVSASMYKETIIRYYQAANDPKQPLDSLSEPQLNEKLVEICEKILQALNTN